MWFSAALWQMRLARDAALTLPDHSTRDSWYGPDPRNLSQEFFEQTVQNCRHILDHVKPKRTRFTIEMMGWNLPDGPDAYLELIKAVDRKAFAVHLDICNGINSPRRFYENSAFIRECFKKLGPWIVSCHGKISSG